MFYERIKSLESIPGHQSQRRAGPGSRLADERVVHQRVGRAGVSGARAHVGAGRAHVNPPAVAAHARRLPTGPKLELSPLDGRYRVATRDRAGTAIAAVERAAVDR